MFFRSRSSPDRRMKLVRYKMQIVFEAEHPLQAVLIVSLQTHDLWCRYMIEATVRSAAEYDLPGVLNLYRHLHPHDPQLETATAERVWSTLLTSNFMTVIVAQATEMLSCTLAIVPNLSRGGRSYGVIENVVTHADYRRLGLGGRVLAHALDIAWQADCYKSYWQRVRNGRPPYASMRERAFFVGAKPTSKYAVLSVAVCAVLRSCTRPALGHAAT